jgi:hypothetical protein
MRRRFTGPAALTALGVVLVFAAVAALPAGAAYPGQNGLIAFRAVNDSGSGVYTIDPANP